MNAHPSWLVSMMDSFTHLGDGPAQIGVLAIVYWCFDRQLGVRMMYLLMFSGTMNGLLKQSFALPRPGWSDPDLLVTQTPTSYGMPSGHAQSAVTWLMWPIQRGGAVAWGAAVLYTGLIGWSRVVIGVHSWSQVAFGWLIGVCCVLAFIWAEQQAGKRLDAVSPTAAFIVLGSLCLGALYMGRETIAAAGTDGLEIWTAYVAREGLQFEMTPVGLRAMVAPLGCLCGLALGELFVVTCRSIPVAHSERLRRALVGSILVAIVYGAVHALLPVRGESDLNLACRFGGAALLGLTVTGLAPWLFGRLGWIGEETRSADDAPVSD